MTRGRKLWLLAQWIFAAAVVWYAVDSLRGQWAEVGEGLRALRPVWSYIAAASALMLLSYAILLEAWRRLLAAWSARLRPLDAARIWLASNLGKYVPGKIWSILAMGALARERGASAVAAGASSVVMQVMSVVTGIAVAALFGAATRGMLWGGVAVMALLLVTLLTAPVLLPRIFAAVSSLTGRPTAAPAVPQRVIWMAAATTLAGWLLAGAAFRVFCDALGLGVGGTGAYISVYAASYVAGFLALFAPGGIGVREGALVATMQAAGIASPAEAAVIAVGSRIWLTLLEIVPGLIALAMSGRGAQNVEASPPQRGDTL